METLTREHRVRGCLLGGAVGDALGYPIEFLSLAAIRQQYGSNGVQGFAHVAKALISDDTQMTLFTAEGLIRAIVRDRERGMSDVAGVVYHAYLRWLYTQDPKTKNPAVAQSLSGGEPDGWVARIPGLFASRAPGNTCLSALRSGVMGTMAA